jgi:hypothetical protein
MSQKSDVLKSREEANSCRVEVSDSKVTQKKSV